MLIGSLTLSRTGFFQLLFLRRAHCNPHPLENHVPLLPPSHKKKFFSKLVKSMVPLHALVFLTVSALCKCFTITICCDQGFNGDASLPLHRSSPSAKAKENCSTFWCRLAALMQRNTDGWVKDGRNLRHLITWAATNQKDLDEHLAWTFSCLKLPGKTKSVLPLLSTSDRNSLLPDK